MFIKHIRRNCPNSERIA